MARLLIGSDWYESVSSSAYYETDFEAILQEEAALLYPEYELIPFKSTVYSEYGAANPDFALIERSFRSWWVVEVELAHHPTSHVLQQVQVFSTAEYSVPEVEYLLRQRPSLDKTALNAMMRGAPPGVLVVVNAPRPDWIQDLSRLGAAMAVVEVFRSDRNQRVLRVNGAYPTVKQDIISVCNPDPLLPRFLRVDSPAVLLAAPSHPLIIEYEGSVAEWEIVQTKDRVWLSPVKTSPVPERGRFLLVKNTMGQFVLRLGN